MKSIWMQERATLEETKDVIQNLLGMATMMRRFHIATLSSPETHRVSAGAYQTRLHSNVHMFGTLL